MCLGGGGEAKCVLQALQGTAFFVSSIKHKGHLFCVSVEQLKTIVSGVFCFVFAFLTMYSPGVRTHEFKNM